MASQEKRYTAYDLLPNSPSSTRWIIDDAEAIPAKLQRLLSSIAPFQVGPNALGETYEVESIAWTSQPDLSKSFHNATLTRDLQVNLKCTKKAAGERHRLQTTALDPEHPVPQSQRSVCLRSGRVLRGQLPDPEGRHLPDLHRGKKDLGQETRDSLEDPFGGHHPRRE